MRNALFLLLLLLFASSDCLASKTMPTFDPASVPAAPEYADVASWLSLPAQPDRQVDVFWVYPTIYFGTSGWIMDIHNASLVDAAQTTITEQASVFEGKANIFAPLYRQMNMAGLALPEEQLDARIGYAYEDVCTAFEYYLEHLNQGRPFFLAGHSQGSNLLTRLAVEHWGKTGVESRFIGAYVIGWSITGNDLNANPNVRVCNNARQTGCFVAYNSVAAGKQSVAPTLVKGTKVVNPLSWETNGAFVPASRNAGAVFFPQDKGRVVVPQFTSAQIQDGGLVVVPADPEYLKGGHGLLPDGVYHMYDYSLFYRNLQENIAERIDAYFETFGELFSGHLSDQAQEKVKAADL